MYLSRFYVITRNNIFIYHFSHVPDVRKYTKNQSKNVTRKRNKDKTYNKQ